MKPSFETVWEENQKKVYSQALRLMGNIHDAGDLVQDTAIRAATSYPKFRGDAPFSTWVYRICKNCYLDWRKRNKRRLNDVSFEDSGVHTDSSEVLTVGAMVAQEAFQVLVSHLDRVHLEILTMYHLNGDTYEDIADRLKIPLGTVKSRLFRARLISKRILEKHAA